VALERQPEPIVDVPAVAASSSSVTTATSDGQGGVVKH
jgi:ATP-dependent Lon protease